MTMNAPVLPTPALHTVNQSIHLANLVGTDVPVHLIGYGLANPNL